MKQYFISDPFHSILFFLPFFSAFMSVDFFVCRPFFRSFLVDSASPFLSCSPFTVCTNRSTNATTRINFLPSSEKLEGYYKYLARRIKGTQCTVEKPQAIYDRLSSINILPRNWAPAALQNEFSAEILFTRLVLSRRPFRFRVFDLENVYHFLTLLGSVGKISICYL